MNKKALLMSLFMLPRIKVAVQPIVLETFENAGAYSLAVIELWVEYAVSP